MMRFFLVTAPPILTMDVKLGNLCNPKEPYDFIYNDLHEYLGKLCETYSYSGTRYNDEIYFYMSRGILNPNILETIPNQQILQSVMIAPSIILSEAWKSDQFKLFYTTIFNNLFEDTPEEKRVLDEQTQSEQHGPLSHLPECYGYTQERWRDGRYHYRWNITSQEI